jgi:hypothetical protein
MEWSEVINNPLLQNLPFKIELNKFGQVLMSPASNQHGRLQGRLAGILMNKLPGGEVITECSIQTGDGVKVADVAYDSTTFIAKY